MLARKLASIRSLRDLTSLFVSLGYHADWTPCLEDAVAVARWKGFRVIAAEGSDLDRLTRNLARATSRFTPCALVIGFHPPATLALGASRLGSIRAPRLLRISLTEPDADALEFLSRLRPVRTATALQHALRIDDLFASEAVSERFYIQFRRVHQGMMESLVRVPTERERRMLALLALIRVLFLYFIQAKGWLDHRNDFLRHQFDRTTSAGRHFHRHCLNVLFFKTLNTPINLRTTVLAGEIPYLNGGLFEPHPSERRHPRSHFTNALWQMAFDDLFDRFRFCVTEAREVDAIAPDMLGRVFERIMETEIRLNTGTFYTPDTIVRELVSLSVQSSIVTIGKLTQSEAVRVLAGTSVSNELANRAAKALDDIRLLDPAVGSGAFLLSALDILTHARLALATADSTTDRLTIRKRILRENLFGVDLNPVAVKLAELRLWLAVITEDDTQDIAAIEPLPNLDGVVRQGDSLIDPVGTARTVTSVPTVSLVEKVATARQAIFEARRRERGRALAHLRRIELAAAREALEHSITSTTKRMREIVSVARGRDLFGHRNDMGSKNQQVYRTLKENRRASRKALTAVREGSVPFFSYEVHAPDVMQEGGFTTVVGNPPWIRAERLAPFARRELKQRFSWWRAPTERGFNHLPDVSIAFTQRAIELTRDGGTVGFLLPSKMATAAYGECARNHLISTTSLEYIHRLPTREAAGFGATTYPMALIARKSKPRGKHRVKLDFNGIKSVSQHQLVGSGPWILVQAPVRDAINELLNCGRPLRSLAPARLGVKTGANDIFLGTVKTENRHEVTLSMQDGDWTFSRNEVRPVLRGRDIKCFAIQPIKWMIWGHDPTGEPRRTLSPTAISYFAPHRRHLAQRTDYRGGPVWTVFRMSASKRNHRVVWSDIVRRPQAAVLSNSCDVIPLNTCYVSTLPDFRSALLVAAVMNSTWISVLVTLYADEARGGYRRMNARVANIIPIPLMSSATQDLCEVSRAAYEAQTFDQHTLDTVVAKSLRLSSRSRRSLEMFDDRHR